MWAGLWLAVSVTCACAQQASTRVQQGGSYEWGWNHEGPATVGHYFVKLPQSEQRVHYAADESGYHSSLAVNTSDENHRHTATFALGHRALQLNDQLQAVPQSFQLPEQQNNITQQGLQANAFQNSPVEIFLLQQHYPTGVDQGEIFQVQPTSVPGNIAQYSSPPYIYVTNNGVTTPVFNNIQQTQSYPEPEYKNNDRTEKSRIYQTEDLSNQEHEVLTSNVVKVFKDHNCSHSESSSDSVGKESVKKVTKPNRPTKLPKQHTTKNYEVKHSTSKPLSYRGAVNFKVESPRQNARSERYYYYTTVPTPTQFEKNKNDGINKLVQSTQDLISNEDLLKINHAAEKQVNIHTDDLIKPRSRFSLRRDQTVYRGYEAPRNRITVKAKIGNIVDSDSHNNENYKFDDQILQTGSNEYKFISPIIVAEPNIDYKEQIVNNIVSTMVPYIEEGFELVSIKNSLDENNDENKEHNGDEENARPLGHKYLAPITVALRLLNANDSDTFNNIEEPEGSESESILRKVQKPSKGNTVVEIQKSVPVSITHINDVEVHEYLDEGRSNKGPYDVAKSLYNKYIEALESSKKIQQNMNDMLYKYGTMKDFNNSGENNEEGNETKENLDSSENVQTEVKVELNDETSNERSEHLPYYEDNSQESQQLIQPIIIEKEVPVTKFVDRFIEKRVPYPEPFEVVKEVPVDRPVPYPVRVEKVVEKPVEVTKYVDKPYPVEIHHPFPVEVKVPYPVEQKVFVDRPVHVPYPIEKVIEKQVVQTVPVPTPVAVPVQIQVPVEQKVLYPIPIETPVPVPVQVEKQVPVERIVHKEVPVPYPVEKRVPYPVPYETKVAVPYPVEKRVPVPVEKIVEKPVTITKYVEKPIHIQVPVPQPVPVAVHVREPYPVDRIVEKKVPYPVPVDRIVEKKVHVKVPYPVQTVVEKIVEKPVIVTKYVDKPYPVEKRVPYPVEKIVEKKVPYAVHIPFEVKVPYPVEKLVEKNRFPTRVPSGSEKYQDKLYPFYYGYGQGAQQTQYFPQYSKPTLDLQKQATSQQTQFHGNSPYIKDRLRQQTTHWGNQYASSYQYFNANNSKPQHNDVNRSLVEYINYMKNTPSNSYYGPPPLQNNEDWWQKNKNYVVEMKVRRTDRTPKLSKFRIEYGGFKPPLIPSTEVDLDGIPVNKKDQSQT